MQMFHSLHLIFNFYFCRMHCAQDCYEREGVNHQRNCQEVVKAYVERISHPSFKAGPVEMADLEK
jgi:hypothetical protein